jgi:hypothetical protein
MAPNTFPAKYSFDIAGTPDCTNDYAVFPLNTVGVDKGQANLVGINNLYSGSNPTGLCGTSPTINWSYNGSTAGGVILTSAQLSLDGTRIVYVESAAGSAIFHILTWKAGDGSSSTSAVTPTASGTCVTGGNCLVSLTYSPSSTATLASPWVDYDSDKAYVAGDDGTVYRLSCAFNCPLNTTPAIDWSFKLPVAGTGGSNPVPSGPAYDSVSGRIILSDQLGEVWTLKDGSTPTLIGASMVGGGLCTVAHPPNRTGTGRDCVPSGLSYGVPDTPLVDVTTSKIFAASGNDGAKSNSAVIVQMAETLGNVITVHVGIGSVANTTSNVDLHAGAFDNNYLNGIPNQGHIYLCGTDSALTYPTHYWVGFKKYPTMDSTFQGKLVRIRTAAVPCSPYTEFYNPNISLGGNPSDHDELVSGINGTGGDGYIATDDISEGKVLGLNSVGYSGGVSAIVPDNISTDAQNSSFYFANLQKVKQGTCAGFCAVKLTQTSLQ